MISARFHGEARLEFLDEIAYYEAIETGLGKRFLQSVEAAIALAVSLPFAGSPYKHGTRRVFTTKFPFSIVYRVGEDEIVIFAIAHFKRKPGYWKSRKRDD